MSTRRQRGLTLIEMIVFIVVVSVGLAGILLAYNTAVKSSADPMARKQALAIAEALLEEVASKAYSGPTRETDRALMDDVDDYAGLSLTGDQTLGSATLGFLAAYTAEVAVAPATLDGVAAKRIDVRVSGRGEDLALSAYRTDY